MFDVVNKQGGISSKIEINSTSGIIAKSSPESKFVRFHMGSVSADMFFALDRPHKAKEKEYPYKKEHVIVLQVMLCGENEFLVEYIDDDSSNEANK
jgi:hypothetical protein